MNRNKRQNMKLFDDERAENPIEVGLYVILAIIVMAFLMMATGAFLDSFDVEITALQTKMPLSAWGDRVLDNYMNYINYAYYIPSIFITIVLIWGVRAVIRKHDYTTSQEQQYNNTEDF